MNSRAAFGQRRKTLINALKGGGFAADDIVAALDRASVDGTRRGETLTLDEFGDLSEAFLNKGHGDAF